MVVAWEWFFKRPPVMGAGRETQAIQDNARAATSFIFRSPVRQTVSASWAQ